MFIINSWSASNRIKSSLFFMSHMMNRCMSWKYMCRYVLYIIVCWSSCIVYGKCIFFNQRERGIPICRIYVHGAYRVD